MHPGQRTSSSLFFFSQSRNGAAPFRFGTPGMTRAHTRLAKHKHDRPRPDRPPHGTRAGLLGYGYRIPVYICATGVTLPPSPPERCGELQGRRLIRSWYRGVGSVCFLKTPRQTPSLAALLMRPLNCFSCSKSSPHPGPSILNPHAHLFSSYQVHHQLLPAPTASLSQKKESQRSGLKGGAAHAWLTLRQGTRCVEAATLTSNMLISTSRYLEAASSSTAFVNGNTLLCPICPIESPGA